MKHEIVVFTKVPKAGITKTRLTTERGGILTPEEALAIYEGCLLDVLNVCIEAKCGEVAVCFNYDGDRDYLEQFLNRVPKRSEIKMVFADQGGTFDECMQYAADYVLKHGKADRLADDIVIVGGDLPSLQPEILRKTVALVEKMAASQAGQEVAKHCEATSNIGAALVEGACQEGGFSIISYTCTTPFDFSGVFYNQDGVTALDMIVAKATEQKIPFGIVEMVPDVDIPLDLSSQIPVIRALALAARYDDSLLAPLNTLNVFEEMGLESSALPPER